MRKKFNPLDSFLIMRKTLFVFLILLFFILIPLHKTYAFAEDSSAKLLPPLKARTLAVKEADNRAKILRAFLEKENSPLADNAETFINAADTNHIDWKFVAAISGVESTFGQAVPVNCNNAWGFGIYGDNMQCFSSYDEGIRTVSHSLREDYMNKWGATDVWSIGHIYAASPTWSARVDMFMTQIDEFATVYQSPQPLPISM